MIDTQTLNAIRGDQFEDVTVRLHENLGVFDPHAREIVDVEEAPVIDFVRRNAPISQTIVLLLQDGVETIDRGRNAARVVRVQRRLDGGERFGSAATPASSVLSSSARSREASPNSAASARSDHASPFNFSAASASNSL